MELHKLLSRQLDRLDLNQHINPADLKKWQEFLDRINKTYNEIDQERYLLERSMEISSREMNELNEKLEVGQQIARLGYWSHNIATGKNVWSKELYRLFGLDFSKPSPDIKTVLEMTHEQDRPRLKKLIDEAFQEGKSYETEVLMKTMNGGEEYTWYYIIAHPIKENEKPIQQLSGIAMDISKRKQIEEEVENLHQQLITSARRAGMADVATSILHNVGNILNSARVSGELIMEYINSSYFNNLASIGQMLTEHHSNISNYLTNDKKGKLIPEYLITATQELKRIQQNIIKETENLNHHMEHIKDITAMQKMLSGVASITENINVSKIIDTAMSMCGNFETNQIIVTKDIDTNLVITTDKSKLLQILINLIHNAKDAIIESSNLPKKLLFVAKKKSDNYIEISVTDNGVGITKDNLTQIFKFGFTTKKHGHGFGLHSSALTAREIQGDLKVESAGYLQGSTFSLTLPTNFNGKKDHGKKE